MRTAGQGPGGLEKREGFMKSGQDLVMVGSTGFAGTCRIGARKRGELEAHFSPTFLNCLDQVEESCVRQWMERGLPQKDCVVTVHEYAGEGGVLAAPWNLSGISNVGTDVDLRALPVRQVTVEVCELYELNLYGLPCGDCVTMAPDRGGQLVRRLKAAGTPGAVIGCVTGDIARQIRHGEETVGYLEWPKPDELLKIIDSYAAQHQRFVCSGRWFCVWIQKAKDVTTMREKILAVIEKSSRIDIKDPVVLSGENEVAVANEIATMEKEHIICGYHTLINWDSTGDEKVVTLIEVKITPQRGMGFDKIAERIYQYSEVGAVYLMDGAYDFIVFIGGETMRQVVQFASGRLALMESVLSTATHLVLKKYKDHGTVISESMQDERMLITP